MELEKSYNPKSIETKHYEFWIENRLFSPQIDRSKKPYTILIPPPNVTGILHMGHVLNNTIQDCIIRFKRMQGFSALWLPGYDHAGIATQNVVERELNKEGKTRFDIGREKLVERIWKWKEQKGGTIIEQLKKLGCSCDWERLRFTMDDGLSLAVKEVFVSLYQKGLIYKGERIINWCPRCTTALANDEVEHKDVKGKLWFIEYHFADKKGSIQIATTRPETMLADVAVSYHPEDERYSKFFGKDLILPIKNQQIPFIADEYVDKDFGTGCVKITPAHDPNDFDLGERHNLEKPVAIDKHGKMTAYAGAEFEGLDRIQAREKVVKRLSETGHLKKVIDYTHSVGHCYRCDTAIEPYLSKQWFVKMKPLAAPAIEVVKNKKISFQPKRWTKVYLHWMENVRDWCISRQIWWGHRIPAYYCQRCSNIEVSKDFPEKCSKCGCTDFVQDSDVLDTWFSSALWPFSTLGWPDKTDDLNYFLPTNTLVTAPEIIYLWVARMIMTTLEFEQKIPFDTVLLHGIVRDEKGRKMSKSLGNSPDPIKIINQVGADALRFAIIYHTPKGEDSYFGEQLLESGKFFCNKIWNAFRYITFNLQRIKQVSKREDLHLSLADRWIYARLYEVNKSATINYEKLRLNDVAQSLQSFIWKDFCSWYLELSKEQIYADDKKKQSDVLFILLDVFATSMKLLSPIMPFITEEIFQKLNRFFPNEATSICISRFPKVKRIKNSKTIIEQMGLIQQAITSIRDMKKEVGLSPSVQVNIVIKTTNNSQTELFNENKNYLSKLARVGDLKVGIAQDKPKNCLGRVVGNVQIFLPLEGVIDPKKQKEKLSKQRQKLEKEIRVIDAKLKNSAFIQKAPSQIVEKERDKFEEVSGKLAKIVALLQEISG